MVATRECILKGHQGTCAENVSDDADATYFMERERFKKVSARLFNMVSDSEYMNGVMIRPSRERNHRTGRESSRWKYEGETCTSIIRQFPKKPGIQRKLFLKLIE